MDFFGSGYSATSGVGVHRPGVDTPIPIRNGLTGLKLLQALRQQLIADNNPFAIDGLPEAAVAQAHEEYLRPSGPAIRCTTSINSSASARSNGHIWVTVTS